MTQPSFIQTIAALGFVPCVGFECGEVWTNPESPWLTQVWIHLSGIFEERESLPSGLHWDARDGLDLAEFFKWWQRVSAEAHHATVAEQEAGVDF
jgi:hypothetical protein